MANTTIVRQVSVFLENRPGRLEAILGTLADHNINIRALSLADTSDYGLLRMILSDTEEGMQALKGSDYTATVAEVLRVEMSDKPGGLRDVMVPLASAGINVEYVYAFVDTQEGQAAAVLKVDDLQRALNVLNN